jgi:hypothetical protein
MIHFCCGGIDVAATAPTIDKNRGLGWVSSNCLNCCVLGPRAAVSSTVDRWRRSNLMFTLMRFLEQLRPFPLLCGLGER